MRIAKSFLRAFTGLTLLLAVGCGEEGPTLLDDVQPQFGVSSDVLGQVGGPLLPTHTVRVSSQDPSGLFHARFFFRPDQSLDVLDDLRFGGEGNAVAMGGIVIRPCKSAKRDKSCKSVKIGRSVRLQKSKKG